MTTAEIIEQLRQSFELIRDERNLYANTATRIGNAFLSLLELFSNVSGLADQFKDIFLSSKENDIAEGIISFLNGLKVGKTGNYGIDGNGDAELHDINGNKVTVVEAVVSGLLRATSAVINSLVSGNITTQSLTVTGAAHFFSLIIDELRSVGGSVILTAANANVDEVEEVSAGIYRLSWRATDGEKKIYNQFIPGDGVICMTFNASEASGTAVNNKYYWMRCTEAGTMTVEEKLYNYILLDSSVGSALNNAIPEAGDKIVQLGYSGSASDAAQRQSAIIIAAYNSPDNGIYAPMVAHYSGINDFTLTTHRKTYVSLGDSKFVGNVVIKTTDENNQTVYVDIVDMLNGLVVDMEAIKQQTDGMMVIYFSYGAPSKSSAPASGWAEADYPRHVGDLYYDKYTSSTTYGHAWQWSLESGIYDWKEITDKHTIAALQAAAAAQAEAEQKVRCFGVQPYPPYGVGDLWMKANGEVLRCVVAKDETGSFAETDWVLKVPSEDPKAFYERLYNVNPSAFDDNSRGYIDILKGTGHVIAEGNFYYVVDTSVLYQAQSSELVEITDSGAKEVIQQALSSYDFVTAGYRRIFLTEPTASYYAGNIYIKKYNVYNALNREQVAAGRDIYVCHTSNSSSYSSSDWLRVSLSSSAELKVLGNIIRGLVYDANGSSLLELTSKAITIINNAFEYDSNGNITGTKISGLLTEDGATKLFSSYLKDNNYVKGSDLDIAVDGIAATVRGQNVYPNLFGFSDGLTFDGTCVPFIQAYGVEFAGSGNGYIRFGGKSVNGVTISFSAKAVGAETNVNFYINGNTGVTTKAIDTDWTDITLNVPSVTSLVYLRAYYSNADVTTVVLKNIKVESGNIATDFCISDADGKVLKSDNMYTTIVDYDKDPIFNKINGNESLDTSDTDGHGNVMTFYRNNNSAAFMIYNGYDWGVDQYTKALLAGKVYTISFWAKSAIDGLKIHAGLYGYVTASGSGTTTDYNTHNSAARYTEKATGGIYANADGECIHTLTTSWKRYYSRFYIQTGVTCVPIIQCNNGLPLGSEDSVYLYIADVRFEEGYIADESDPMSISGARTRSESKFNLTADKIELKLNNTGIDIENNLITLDANKTIVNGELQASKVLTNNKGYGYIDMTDGLMKVFNPNGINQIVFGVDSSGNIILQYLDKDTGRVLWDLGPTGMRTSKSQDERVVTYTWCMMKEWNSSNNTWEQVGLDAYDTDVYALDNYYRQIQNGASMSYLAYLIKNGTTVGNGLVYQYEAKINAGQYIGTAMSNNSATVAEVYDKLFLQRHPSSSSPLAVSGGGAASNSWYAGFIRIKKFEIWRTYDMGAMITQSDSKSYVIPSEYVDGVNGDMVDFSVDTANGTYNDPPVCFYAQSYEYGVLKEDIPYWINYSKIEGL
ncbi:MAG: hypothetical protein J5957_00915 [Prevotella sp.]|nr:hypothetical protein [Prevotella sp.]